MQNSTQQQAVTSFLRLVTTGKIAEGYARFVHPDMRHHNQYYKGDRATLQKGMEDNHVKFPLKQFETKQILEDGDRVMTFSKVGFGAGGPPDCAVVHIFRFKDGKIVEMWDIGQPLQEDMPNENGVF